jgi:TolB-like protein/Tfp pilus assembly protein PilF
VAAAVLLVAVAGGGFWWWLEEPPVLIEPAQTERMAFPLPEKPSIVILPFANLSGDPEQDYLGDGLTENIIAELATSPSIFVIARNSSFTFKGKPTKVQDVAEQLGVRYVLEGSVQRQGERLRVTAQLIDAIEGQHLWADRYDRDLTDLFALQDDITFNILEELHVNLTIGEGTRAIREAAADPEIFRLLVQGRFHFGSFSPKGHEIAERLYTEIYERQPDSVLGNNLMAWVHFQKIRMNISQNPGRDLALMREFAEKSLSLDENYASTHILLAAVNLFSRNHVAAIAHAGRAVELNPANGLHLSLAGWVLSWSGQPQKGIGLLKQGMRLEPYHQFYVPQEIAFGHMMLGQYEEAKAILESLLESPIGGAVNHLQASARLAAISIFQGDVERARQYVKKMLDIFPMASIANARRFHIPLKDKEFRDRIIEAMRTAGLPES